MQAALLIIIIALLVVIAVLLWKWRQPKAELPLAQLEERLRLALVGLASAQSIKDIKAALNDVPRKVVDSIIRSAAWRTGKLSELMATLELTEYDRLFYLGEPIDFIGIKYDQGVYFIEVKTKGSSLTPDEERLKSLIDSKKVEYVPLSVERISIAQEFSSLAEGEEASSEVEEG